MLNAIHEQGALLFPEEKMRLIKSAKSQTGIIINFLNSNPKGRYTSEQIHILTNLKCPLTSIRRVLSNLYYANEIKKHQDDKEKSKYGVHICTWSLI